MTGWEVPHEQWAEWLIEDAAVVRGGLAGPLDALDAQLLERLIQRPFPANGEQTVTRPAKAPAGMVASFESRTTMVRSSLGDDENSETVVREPEGLEVALAAPEGGLEVTLRPPGASDPPSVVAGETVVSDVPPVEEAPPAAPEDNGLFIPALTRTLVATGPPSEEVVAEAPPPAISGETVVGAPPDSAAQAGDSAVAVTSGMITPDTDEAAQTLIRGEIPVPGEVAPRPSSKVVIDPSASGVISAVYDEDEDDDDQATVIEEEPQELDADDLVEEADDEPEAAAPPPPVVPLDVGPPPPPVSEAVLEAAVSAIAAAPPMDEGWQIDAFGEHSAALLPVHRAASAAIDVDFILHCTGLSAGATVLDVGCGDGAHAVAFAARGLAVTGLDPSPAQLMRASQAAQTAGVAVNLVSGDMRQPVVEGPFDTVVCLGGTLGMYGDEDDRLALQHMRQRLAPGGRLMLQVLNRDYIVGRLPARSWWQGQGCLVLDEAQIYAPTSRVHVHRTIVFETGTQFAHNVGLRVYGLTDLVHMCAQVGLSVLEYSGSRHSRGRFYGATSSEIWLLARRTDG